MLIKDINHVKGKRYFEMQTYNSFEASRNKHVQQIVQLHNTQTRFKGFWTCRVYYPFNEIEWPRVFVHSRHPTNISHSSRFIQWQLCMLSKHTLYLSNLAYTFGHSWLLIKILKDVGKWLIKVSFFAVGHWMNLRRAESLNKTTFRSPKNVGLAALLVQMRGV